MHSKCRRVLLCYSKNNGCLNGALLLVSRFSSSENMHPVRGKGGACRGIDILRKNGSFLKIIAMMGIRCRNAWFF